MKKLLVIALALALASIVVFGACSSSDNAQPTTRVAEPTDVIDQDLMVALLQAKNFHHKAKVYMADGNAAAAIESVREILSLKFPAGAPEADDVRADARALLAKLLTGQGKLDDAMRVVDEGIAQSPRESFFVANLYTVKGEIHQAKGEQLKAGGDEARAKDAFHEAITALDRSITINRELLKRMERQ
jgi:tetratricopeptide (TPR) repeat protein